MTQEHDLARPRTTPRGRRAKPPRAATPSNALTQSLAELAPELPEPWSNEGSDAHERTLLYTHPEGHRIGLRLQGSDLIIQTWITAGPELPPLPDGTAAEKAEAQAANDARIQPGRTWHRVIRVRHTEDLKAALGTLLREELPTALITKPKRIHTVTWSRASPPKPEDDAHAEQHSTEKKEEEK